MTEKLYLSPSGVDIPLRNPKEKILECYKKFTEDLKTEIEKTFSQDDKPYIIINKDNGGYYRIELAGRPTILSSPYSEKICRENNFTQKSEVKVNLRIFSKDKFSDKETLVGDKNLSLFTIPQMNQYGTFIKDGNEYALATLYKNGNFINPGTQLKEIYSAKLNNIRNTIKAKSDGKNYNLSTVDLDSFFEIKKKDEVVNKIFEMPHFMYLQDNNDLGRFRLINLVIKQRLEREDSFVDERDAKRVQEVNEKKEDLSKIDLGFIDTFCSPEGAKVVSSLVLSAACEFETDSKGNYTGKVCCPFHKIINNKKSNDIVYINNEQVDRIKYAKYGTYKEGDNVQYVQASVFNNYQLTTALTPFIHNNQGSRILMSDVHTNASMTIDNPESPMVQTGVEQYVASCIGQMVYSPVDGTVKEIKNDNMVIEGINGKLYDVPLLYHDKRNGKCTFTNKVIVQVGQVVKNGQLLADGPNTRNGEYAYGINARVAHIEKGTYEDLFTVSESFAKKIESDREETFVVNVFSDSKPKLNGEFDKNTKLDENGVIKVGETVKCNDVLVGLKNDKETDKSFIMPAKIQAEMQVRSVRCITPDQFDNDKEQAVKRYIITCGYTHKAENQDKISNRHGNKGTIHIIPDNEMPKDKDGNPVEVIISGISMDKRLNMGQILECMAGNIAKATNKAVVIPSETPNALEILKEKMDELGLEEKTQLYDGITGKPYKTKSIVGYEYIIVHPHLAIEKNINRGKGDFDHYDERTGQGRGSLDETNPRSLGEMAIKGLQSMGKFGQVMISQSLSQSTREGTRNLMLNLINDTDKKNRTIDKSVDRVLRAQVGQLNLIQNVRQRREMEMER